MKSLIGIARDVAALPCFLVEQHLTARRCKRSIPLSIELQAEGRWVSPTEWAISRAVETWRFKVTHSSFEPIKEIVINASRAVEVGPQAIVGGFVDTHSNGTPLTTLRLYANRDPALERLEELAWETQSRNSILRLSAKLETTTALLPWVGHKVRSLSLDQA